MNNLPEFPMQASTSAKAKIDNFFIVRFFLFSAFEMSVSIFKWFDDFVSVSNYL